MSGRIPTVLVLGVGSNVSQGILKALAIGRMPCRVVTACVTPSGAGLYRSDRAYLSPYADDPTFTDWVTEICKKEDVAGIMSGVEPVLAALARDAGYIRETTGAVCVVSPSDVLAIGQDKLATSRWLAAHGYPHPGFAHAADGDAVAALLEGHGLPLLAKPRSGRGSRGILTVRTDAEVESLLGREDLVLQELIGDADGEFTVGCFCDADAKLRGSVAMRRDLSEGTTVRADLGDFPEVRDVSERIVAKLRPVGPCNVQLRVAGGQPVPFELNVRFSGTTPARARFGFNDVEEAVRHLILGEPARDLPRPVDGTVLRYWNEMYVSRSTIDALERDKLLEAPLSEPTFVEDWGADR